MRIGVEAAREYFADPTQQKASDVTPDTLPEGPDFQYWAADGVCVIFHRAPWPGVWMAHVGVKPEAWGRTTAPALQILRAFWAFEQPELVIGWIRADNRAALAFAGRLGFRVHGEMNLPAGKVIEQSWRP